MFAVQKASRFVETAPNDVGPGLYECTQHSIQKKAACPAGFGRCEREVYPESKSEVPPVGAYTIQERSNDGKLSAFFRSTTSRQKLSTSETPGPGTYVPMVASPPRVKQHQKQTERVKLDMLATAPSIPGKFQSYGYDETDNGDLVLQEANIDTREPGPGDYEIISKRVHRGVDYSRQTAPRLFETIDTDQRHYHTPGAQYLAAQAEAPPRKRLPQKFPVRPASVFAPKRQAVKVEQVATPGPGSYYSVPQQKSKTRQNRPTPVLKKKIPEPTSPGPGAYLHLATPTHTKKRSVYTSRPVLPQQSDTHSTLAFDSKADRFCDAQKEYFIGPGTYSSPGLADDVKKRLVARKGAFGSTTQRFSHCKKNTMTTPTPEISSPPPPTEIRRRQLFRRKPMKHKKPSAGFASASKRSVIDPKACGPPPGAYNIETNWTNKPTVKIAGPPRFSQDAISSLGPGSYDIPSTLSTHQHGNSSMLGTSTRFDDLWNTDKKSKEPGPGAYDYQLPSGNLLKPTYNLAIAAQSREVYF